MPSIDDIRAEVRELTRDAIKAALLADHAWIEAADEGGGVDLMTLADVTSEIAVKAVWKLAGRNET